MADLAERWEDNLKGPYYVDRNCIYCNLCMEIAPNNFKEADSGDHDIVYKQPENDEEIVQCKDAMEQCPVNAIGNDNI